MSVQLDERFAAALREVLVARADDARRPRRWTTAPKRWVAGAGSVIILAAAGSGIAYAAGVFHTEPGGPAVTALASPVTATGTGTQTVDLGSPPAGTTAIDMTFTCLTAGEFGFADGASVDCGPADAGPNSAPVTYTMSIARGQHDTKITATPGARWRLVATYASVTTTAWGVDAHGYTYGEQNQRGTPDLIAVIATNHRTGYVYANQLFPTPPKSPAQALAQNQARPRTVTVYESDGTTPIGRFTIGS